MNWIKAKRLKIFFWVRKNYKKEYKNSNKISNKNKVSKYIKKNIHKKDSCKNRKNYYIVFYSWDKIIKVFISDKKFKKAKYFKKIKNDNTYKVNWTNNVLIDKIWKYIKRRKPIIKKKNKFYKKKNKKNEYKYKKFNKYYRIFVNLIFIKTMDKRAVIIIMRVSYHKKIFKFFKKKIKRFTYRIYIIFIKSIK